MNYDEVLVSLHKTFGGLRGYNTKVKEIESTADIEAAIKIAYDYYNWAVKAQKNCQSDWSYWMYEGDITLGKCLISILLFKKQGNDAFPDLPNIEGRVLMDSQATLGEWAESLLLDHVHDWEWTHEGNTYFSKCRICDTHRYSWKPPSIEVALGR